MRFRLGNLPETEECQPEPAGWRRLHGPNARSAYLVAGMMGLALLCTLCVGLAMVSLLTSRGLPSEPRESVATPWGILIAVLLLYIPVHEILHIAWHPRFGLSDRTQVLVWPAKMRFGAYYEGCMSRGRWLAMRSSPFIVLSLIPAATLALCSKTSLDFAVETCLLLLMIVNAVGSGGDAIAIAWVLSQTPRRADLCFQGGRAYWRLK